MLSSEQRKSLVEATARYRASLPGSSSGEYLGRRQLASPDVERFRLGHVEDPIVGHEVYRGRLAIPYLRRSAEGRWSVVGMKFRCSAPDCRCEDHPKYLGLPGDEGKPRLFNTVALAEEDDEIGISEGELDAVTATAAGIPTVGVPGVESWKAHFREPFRGYANVYVFADGDGPGMKFARAVAKELPNARIVPMPDGEDVNSVVRKTGAKDFMERIGK
jgi:hypothetical protein